MLATVLMFGVVPQIAAATITVDLIGDTAATVRAEFRLSAATSRLRASVMSQRGQALLVDARYAASKAEGGGLTWLDLSPDSAVSRVTVVYELRGSLSRVPLPVPQIPAETGSDRVHLVVRGLPPGAAIAKGFPRFAWAGDDAVATLDNVPALIRIPPSTSLSVGTVAELLVLLLVLLAFGTWLGRRGRGRSTSAGGDP